MLGWLEMTVEDQPPERIWLDTEALDEHFTNVMSKYASKASGEDPQETIPLQQNELTKGLSRG